MRNRIPAVVGTVVLVAVAAAGCAGGISLRDENGTGISIDENGDISVGNGETELEISGDGEGASDGGAVVTDELINVATDGGTVVHDCGGRSANVVANGATVTLNGSCVLVTVAGSGNQVSVGSATEVNVLGSDNTVYYTSGNPVITDLGSGNTVEQGGDAAP